MPQEVSPVPVQPAKWPIGPPPPRWCTWVCVRGLWLAVLVIMSVWLSAYCDGFGVKEAPKIFSWHPLLMTIAFAVFMTESVLMYRVWGIGQSHRSLAKLLHGSLHTGTVVFVAIAWVAVFHYHKAQGIDNLYSVHSYLGITTTAVLVVQWLVGLMSFGWPRMRNDHRAAYTPVHMALGLGVYFTGLATMLVGIQEKATFEQFTSRPGKYDEVMRLPAVLVVLIVLLGLSVAYHVAPTAKDRSRDERAPLLADDAA